MVPGERSRLDVSSILWSLRVEGIWNEVSQG